MRGSIAALKGAGENAGVIPVVVSSLCFEIAGEVVCEGRLDSAGFERFFGVAADVCGVRMGGACRAKKFNQFIPWPSRDDLCRSLAHGKSGERVRVDRERGSGVKLRI